MSERCERTSERRSEWPNFLRVHFISFETTVHRLYLPLSHSQVQDRDARVLSQIALGYNLVISSVEHRLRQMVAVSQDEREYRRMLKDTVVAELGAHRDVSVRGREALNYLDDCFRKEEPCYRLI